MCLIAFALDVHPELPLVVIANRDELYARPTEGAHDWTDHPGVFAGRDVAKGGTWLGVTRAGRFAALTNVRNPTARRDGLSRGELVKGALTREVDPTSWSRALDRSRYPAFNLLLGEGSDLYYATEETEGLVHVAPGVHALSNARLDVSWPKAEHAKRGLQALLEAPSLDVEAAFAILAARDRAADEALPRTGVPLELERALSPAFLAMDAYGTRASTVVAMARDGSIRFAERSWGPGGVLASAVDVVLTPDDAVERAGATRSAEPMR